MITVKFPLFSFGYVFIINKGHVGRISLYALTNTFILPNNHNLHHRKRQCGFYVYGWNVRIGVHIQLKWLFMMRWNIQFSLISHIFIIVLG